MVASGVVSEGQEGLGASTLFLHVHKARANRPRTEALEQFAGWVCHAPKAITPALPPVRQTSTEPVNFHKPNSMANLSRRTDNALMMDASEPPPSAEKAAMPGPKRNSLGLQLWALSLALIGGVLGVFGAVVQEVQAAIPVLITVLGAPIIEELLKPSGIYILLVRWPRALRGRLHTASLTALSGLVFGYIESLVYITLYFPDGSDEFVIFRLTVTPALHMVASFLVGMGLSTALIDWANGRGPLPKSSRKFFIAGIGLHACYNTLALVLSLSGLVDVVGRF